MSYNYTEELLQCRPEDLELCKRVKYVSIYLICGFGSVSNLVSLLVLPRIQMKSQVKCCLQSLAAFDGLYLILRFITTTLTVKRLWIKILRQVALTTSIWITVLVSVERFIAVCYPLQARIFCTYRRTVYCILLSALLAGALNIPRLFLFRERSDTNVYIGPTLFLNRRYGSQLNETDLLSEKELRTATCYSWLHVAVEYIVPMVVVSSLNICIYRAVLSAEKKRHEMCCSQKHEINLSKTVFAIIIVFLITGAPWLAFGIVNNLGSLKLILYRKMSLLLTPLLAANSAINFIIYFAMNTHFRNTLMTMLWVPRCQSNKVNDVTLVESIEHKSERSINLQ